MEMIKGTYYVGDPCYVLKDYNGFDWRSLLNKHDYFMERGYYQLKGETAYIAGTEYGDGVYLDLVSNKQFPVDAGLLSIIPIELLSNVDGNGKYCHIMTFEEDFKCRYHDGFLTAESVDGKVLMSIDTAQHHLDFDEDEEW